MTAHEDLREGDRVLAVKFRLDEGLRIWPVPVLGELDDAYALPEDPVSGDAYRLIDQNAVVAFVGGSWVRADWRVVEVANQQVVRESMWGTAEECTRRWPTARFSVNDNDTVPPGTQGTVESARSDRQPQVWVAWDNGARLGLTEYDRVEKVG